jgi:hypothetical protein
VSELQEATIRGKAVTGGLPASRTIKHAALAEALARMKFGQWTESREKVPPSLTKEDHPFFILATDQDVVALKECVDWALQLVNDERLSEIHKFVTQEIIAWVDAMLGYNFGFAKKPETLWPTPAECREEVLRRLRILKALAEP